MSLLDYHLLHELQRDFPLTAEPYAAIGDRMGRPESEVLASLTRLRDEGALQRIGAVFNRPPAKASTLAALTLPASEMERAAAAICGQPEVTYKCLREHRYNLWFVASAETEQDLEAALGCIEAGTAQKLLRMPLIREFLPEAGSRTPPAGAPTVAPMQLSAAEQRLADVLREGLELQSHPFQRLGLRADMSEAEVLATIAGWLGRGQVRRFGAMVRRHDFGFPVNALCAWNIPDDAVAEYGHQLAQESVVRLCHLRQRAAPDWPFNLYCLISGRDRAGIAAQLALLSRRHHLTAFASEVMYGARNQERQCTRREVARSEGAAGLPDLAPLTA